MTTGAPLLDQPRGTSSATRGPEGSAHRTRLRVPRWGLLLLLGWLGQSAVRLWLASGQTMPVATPDETGYLFVARVLTGGPGADISFSTMYRGGYPLLLAPAFWFGDDPGTVYRLAIAISALISATLLLLAYQVARRLKLSRAWSYAVANATALLPAAVFYTQFVLTDAVLPVVLLAWLLLLHSWLTSDASPVRVAAYGVAASLTAAFAYAMHTRGIVVLVVHLGLLIVAASFRWRPWRSTGLAVGALAAGAGASTVLNLWLTPQLYPFGSYDMGSMLVDRLTGLEGIRWTVPVGAGQVWYQIVATAGMAGIGLVALAVVAVRRDTAPQLRGLVVAVLVTVFGIAFATSAALPDEQRIGNHAYGRYLACLAPLLFLIGVVVLLRSAWRTALYAAGAAAGATVVIAYVIEKDAGGQFGEYLFFPFDFPETGFLTGDWEGFHLWGATLVGLALLGVLVAMVRVPRFGPALVLGALITVSLAANVSATDHISRPLVRQFTGASDLSRVIDTGTRPTVAIDLNVRWKIRLPQMFQISWAETINFDSRYQPPPSEADLVILYWHKGYAASTSWREAPPGWWIADSRRSAEGDWVAWRRP